MAILDVRLRNVDTSFELNPSRTAEIKLRDGVIETPTRGSNQYEYNAKTRVPTDILIGSKVNMKFTSVSYNTMTNLLRDIPQFAKIYSSQEKSNRIVQHTLLNFALFQPTTSLDPERGMLPSMSIIQESEDKLKTFLNLIIDLQESLRYTMITVPYLELPFNDLKKIYRHRCDEIRRKGAEPFFVIDLKHKHEDFEKIIKFLVDQLQVKLIGLIFKRFKNAALNYYTLREYSDKDVLFYTLQVGRYDHQFNEISSSHYLPFLTNDIFTVAAPRGFSRKEENNSNKGASKKGEKTNSPFNYQNYLLKLSRLKLFDRQDLRLKTFPLSIEVEKILEEVDKSGNVKLLEMLENYEARSNNYDELEVKYGILNSFTKVHEFKASTFEFEKFRKFVKSRETQSYLTKHPILNAAVTEMQ